MPAPDTVLKLCETFANHRDHYRSGNYNEAQLRKEFLDPFFAALGWDMDNAQGLAPQYRDVIHEDALRIGPHVKAPDCAFTLHGQRKFFLEAKKPAVNIKSDVDPAYQLRRYAWSAKMPLSILSDFEEFAIYDTRVKPVKNDPASTARTFYCTCDQFPEKWDEIAAIFSRDAILKGSFDKYAESNKKKKGTAEVDAAFLEEIERWRDLLARNLALRNPSLSVRDLNFAVQKTIDRLVFLRICEDRGTEDYGRLRVVANGTQTYLRLLELFRAADHRYNSGLFHFSKEKGKSEEPDTLTPHLILDDKVLKDIIVHLYYPDSPYEFSVLPANILGSVYEQFLGKVINLTAGHRAIVEDKPEVKNAGGVFYTPSYIVDYIVKQTIGPLIEGKTPKQIERIRILDPACGSGSFLIVAYQFLLDWYHRYYIAHEPEKLAKGKTPVLVNARGGGWTLTTAERKRILLTHIFGVDIDSQAVEVTKLSLLLKVLEGETAQSVQRELIHQRVLPDLGDNIKCGNSLIGSDFYAQPDLPDLDSDAHLRINVFDWGGPGGFPEIMKAGGFDAVIGNPPWGADMLDGGLEYVKTKHREIIVRMIDSFMFFVNKTLNIVNSGGTFGMILPDVLFYQIDCENLRRKLLTNASIHVAINMGNVFDKVTRPSCIVVVGNQMPIKQKIKIADFSTVSKTLKPEVLRSANTLPTVVNSELLALPGAIIATSRLNDYKLWSKVKLIPNIILGQVVDSDGIQRGVSPDLKEAFLLDSASAKQHAIENRVLRPVVTGGRHVRRYRIERPDLLLIYTKRDDDYSKLPNTRAYIDRFRKQITCKEVAEGKHSIYALHRARNEQIFEKPQKILGVITEDEIIVSPDTDQLFATDGLYLFGLKPNWQTNYIIGILNSKLFVFLYRLLAIESGRALAQVKPTVLNQLPIRIIDPTTNTDQVAHNRLISLVNKILNLHKQRAAVKTPHEQTAMDRQIAATDHQIDLLVYELYELTKEEILLVEGQ